MPPLAPRYGNSGIRCCTAETVPVRSSYFSAGGSVDFLDDDGELGARAFGLVLQKRAIDFGKDRVSREKKPRLERLEKELAVRRRLAGRRAGRGRGLLW